MSEAVYLGLDLGTSGLKGVAVHADGTPLARHAHRYPTVRPTAGASEQDPRHWQEAAKCTVQTLVRHLADKAGPPLVIRSVGLSAMIPTLVTTRADLTPIGPAITWEDNRAEADGAALRRALGGHALYQTTGQWVDGRYLLPMYLRLTRDEPERVASTTHLLAAKDFLLHWLTGHLATDPTTATGYGCYDLHKQNWMEAVRDAATEQAHRRLPRLPDIDAAEDNVPVRADLAETLGLPIGTPICVGGADSVLGALGLHATQPGDVAYVAGTSNVIIGISHGAPKLDPQHRYLITPLAGAVGWAYEMDLLATGSVIRWLADLTHSSESDLLTAASAIPPGDAPIFLPFLSPGEQGSRWMPHLTGVLTGLNLTHSAAHIARGLVSGIVAESFLCLHILAEAGITGDIHIAGGASSNPTFRTDLADATGRTVHHEPASHTDYSALGAATLAARSTDNHYLGVKATGAQPTRPHLDAHSAWGARILQHEVTVTNSFPNSSDR